MEVIYGKYSPVKEFPAIPYIPFFHFSSGLYY